jgi:hypothetical protein
VASLSSERARRAGSYMEETSSNEEQGFSPLSLSSSLSLLNACRFFDVIVESSASSLAYLRLFGEEAIGVAAEWNLFSNMCQHFSLYGVTGDPSDEARALFHEKV